MKPSKLAVSMFNFLLNCDNIPKKEGVRERMRDRQTEKEREREKKNRERKTE